MAYQPSLSDIEEDYQPSLSDIEEIPSSQNKNIFPFFKPDQNKQTLEQYIPGIRDPRQLGTGAIQAAGTLGSIFVPEIPAIATGATILPKALNALSKIIPGSIFGAMSSPDHPIAGGVLGALPYSLPWKSLNPFNYTYGNIAKGVLNERSNMKNLYDKTYENIFNEADKGNLGKSALKEILPSIDFESALANEPKKAMTRINEFQNNPVPRTAHDAKSDLLKIQRKLNDKYEREGLSGNEPKKLDAINDAVNKIESNMFIGKNGVDQNLANQYRQIQAGYDKDVLTYTRNKAINSFIKGELSEKELINSLSKGKFSAKRGEFHPEISTRNRINKLSPYLAGLLGLGGAYELGKNVFSK